MLHGGTGVMYVRWSAKQPPASLPRRVEAAVVSLVCVGAWRGRRRLCQCGASVPPGWRHPKQHCSCAAISMRFCRQLPVLMRVCAATKKCLSATLCHCCKGSGLDQCGVRQSGVATTSTALARVCCSSVDSLTALALRPVAPPRSNVPRRSPSRDAGQPTAHHAAVLPACVFLLLGEQRSSVRGSRDKTRWEPAAAAASTAEEARSRTPRSGKANVPSERADRGTRLACCRRRHRPAGSS